MNRNIRFRAIAAAWSLFSTALCAPGAYAQGSSAPGVANGHAPMPRVVAVLRFAVAGQPVISGSMLSAHACPTSAAAGAAANETPLKVDPAILDQISAQMQKKLSQKATVLLNPPETAIPAGALTISGCITRADSGNASGRLVGMGVGDSHLNVRVVALVRVKDGWHRRTLSTLRSRAEIFCRRLA